MIIILTNPTAAPVVANALGDKIEPGQRLWLSPSIDVRAVKESCALAGDHQAYVINLDSFAVGAITCALLICMVFGAYAIGIQIGRSMRVSAPTETPTLNELGQQEL